MSWTWRQAATYSPGLLSLASSDHGYQSPFISWAKRRYTGLPKRLRSRAHERMYASGLPSTIVASRYSGCERYEPTDWSHGSQLICGVLPRRATAFSWRMLTGRRQSANHCTIEACALAVCSKRLTWLRSRGFHGIVAFLASAAAVTPRRRSPLLDHAIGGTLACAGPVV